MDRLGLRIGPGPVASAITGCDQNVSEIGAPCRFNAVRDRREQWLRAVAICRWGDRGRGFGRLVPDIGSLP